MSRPFSPRLRMLMQRAPTVYEPDDLAMLARRMLHDVRQCGVCRRQAMQYTRWHLEMRTDVNGSHTAWLVATAACSHCAAEHREADVIA